MDTLSAPVLELYRAARELPIPEFEEQARSLLESIPTIDSGRWQADDLAAVAQSISLHVSEAGAINRLLWFHKMSFADSESRGARATANRGGLLYHDDDAFAGLLRREWPDWTPPLLPHALVETCADSIRFVGKRVVITCRITGQMLFLRAREKAEADSLTPAEHAVATLVAEGLSYKQVARQTERSPSTVRNELHSAYLKLGIRNKASLGQRLGRVADR